MKDRFSYSRAEVPEPIRIEQVYAEKPAGGIVVEPGFNAPETTAVGLNANGKYAVIKGYRLVSAVGASDTTINIAKGSGVAVNDIVAYGKKGVKCTKVDATSKDKDVVTVSLGIAIAEGEVLYQAKAASDTEAEPIYTPDYILGNMIFAGKGEQPVRLINGANVRKETACIGKDIEAMLPTIKRV
ncbi:hypothetical protein [Parabacteroides johnsonii]|uniref:hypothetical protein n=1 Tax=Parabacteroides johnsonii TaxID=387661 RepID=UPI002431A035|nr:hypothetical protein [Parabacteroides johnsonii]